LLARAKSSCTTPCTFSFLASSRFVLSALARVLGELSWLRLASFADVESEMTTPESIQSAIEAGVACDRVEVSGDGQHFQALIVSKAFEGLSKVRRHQLVYGALGDRMREEIHALSMTTLTPVEWAQRMAPKD